MFMRKDGDAQLLNSYIYHTYMASTLKLIQLLTAAVSKATDTATDKPG